jgi:cobyrinic acid a,c-diamide synthase
MVIAGERGGVGKTTLSVGLLAAWRARGWQCRAFKKGPDYIDSAWLAAASGHVCRCLDIYLMSEAVAARSFREHAIETGVNLVEGNRGLFDGVDAEGTFSTAELAKLLSCPVILVIDCEKRTRTTAAVALGCRLLDRDVRVVGVILNRLGTARQERIAREAVEQGAGICVLGAVPRLPDLAFRERRLGLVPPQEQRQPDTAIRAAAEAAEKYLDMERLWKAAFQAVALPQEATDGADTDEHRRTRADTDRMDRTDTLRIGYFFDSAFHFYYPENLEALERWGASLVSIDAQHTPALPPELDGLYIGGGFPEERAAALSLNATMRESVRAAAENGLPIYAECGGLMYLGRQLTTRDGSYPMAGVLPYSTVVEMSPQGHGYVEAVVAGGHPFLTPGSRIRGHEFHYSRPVDWDEKEITFALSLSRGQGFGDGRDGVVRKNTVATYVHVHALGEPQWAHSVVDLCRRNRRNRCLASMESAVGISAAV